MMIIIGIIAGLILGSIACYLILKPKLTSVIQINQEIVQQNDQYLKTNLKLKQHFDELTQGISTTTKVKEELEQKIQVLEARREEIQRSLEISEQQAKQAYDTYIEQCREGFQNKYDNYVQSFSQEVDKWKEQAEQDYKDLLLEQVEFFQQEMSTKRIELAQVTAQIEDLQAKAAATIEAHKRDLERLEQQDFYKIQVQAQDLYEIEQLRKIIPFLRNSRPVCKIIWESYYRNPTSDMVNRVLGANVHTGIYKITHPETGLAYVGQAVDVASRFKEHIKCGLGIDAPANKLYSAMQKYGVENFTFELLEDCPRASLNEREKYYIELYHTQEWGWNQTKGGSASK